MSYYSPPYDSNQQWNDGSSMFEYYGDGSSYYEHEIQNETRYQWDELYDDNESKLYYYNNWTGEMVWEMPVNFDGVSYELKKQIENMTDEDIHLISKIQKAYRARLAKKQAKVKIDKMMMDDYFRGYENYIQRNDLRAAIEELHGMHDILKKYKHEDIDKWHDICKKLRDMRMELQTDLYFKAIEYKKEGKVEEEYDALFECLTILEDMNTKSWENERMASVLLSSTRILAKRALTLVGDYQKKLDNALLYEEDESSDDEDDSNESDQEEHEGEKRKKKEPKPRKKTTEEIVFEDCTKLLSKLNKLGLKGEHHKKEKEKLIMETKDEVHPEKLTNNDKKIDEAKKVL